MALLRFKSIFHDAIRHGRKTTTLRRWGRAMVRAGTHVLAPGVGSLLIERVESVNWDHLAEADARADGFDSLAEMRSVVRKIYPNSNHDGKAWFRVHFRLADERPGAAPLRQRQAKPVSSAVSSRTRKLKPPLHGQHKEKPDRGTDRAKLAAVVRAELDKAVRKTGS